MATDPPYFVEARAAGRLVVTGIYFMICCLRLPMDIDTCVIETPKLELDAYIANYRG